ncbi:MAG: DUF922 domain-containing Zn-dependent protease [Rhizobiaceae bacterium]
MFFRSALIAVFVVFPASLSHAGWKPVEREKTYAIYGKTGVELYESIGENGPKLGPTRAIAYTDFKLTWRRDYRPQSDGSCKLVSAMPKLIITYKLPKPASRLSSATKRRWATFIDGIRTHEKVHGEQIIDMVRKIEAVSVGFSHDDDPKCKKIYGELKKHLARLSQEQRAQSRAFDKLEMSNGGNVHQLILGLVDG